MQTLMKNKDLHRVQVRKNGLENPVSRTNHDTRATKDESGVCVNLVDRKINELHIEVSSLKRKL
jgi:hypothetical protein